jgi:site-specific DNA-cytosine methylase
MRAAIQSGSGTTGETFGGLAAFVSVAKTTFIVLENVPALADKPNNPKNGSMSNLDAVHNVLNSLGYLFTKTVFSAYDVGLAQRRKRLWMGAWKSEEPAEACVDKERHITQILEAVLAS